MWDKGKNKMANKKTIQEVDLTDDSLQKASKYLDFSKRYSIMHLLEMSRIDKRIIDKVPKNPYKDELIKAISTTVLDVEP